MSAPRAISRFSDLPKIAVIVLAVNVALYGCTRPVPSKSATPDRVRALESRCAKLESDFRTMTQARDKARADLARMEAETARLQKELNSRIPLREGEELRAQLKEALRQGEALRQSLTARTTERDRLQDRADRLRKGLQSMLSQDEGPLPASTSATPTPPASSTSLAPETSAPAVPQT